MKSSLIALFLAVTLCGASAQSIPIGAVVASLCPDIQELLGLGQLSVLNATLYLIRDVEIPAPDPQSELVIAAPTDDAFSEFLSIVGVDAANDLSLMASIVANHLAVSNSGDTFFTFADEEMKFLQDAVPVPTSPQSVASNVQEYSIGYVSTEAASANNLGAVVCPKQTAFVINSVLLPAARGDVSSDSGTTSPVVPTSFDPTNSTLPVSGDDGSSSGGGGAPIGAIFGGVVGGVLVLGVGGFLLYKRSKKSKASEPANAPSPKTSQPIVVVEAPPATFPGEDATTTKSKTKKPKGESKKKKSSKNKKAEASELV